MSGILSPISGIVRGMGGGIVRADDGTFSPTQIANFAFWHDPSAASSITLNVSDVAQEADLSGNSRNAAQATSANQPAYLTGASGINSLGAVGFTGSNTDSLALASARGVVRNVPGFSFVGVVRIPTLGSAQRILSVTVSGSSAARFFAGVSSTGALTIDTRRLDADATSSLSSTATATAATAAFCAWTVNYLTGDVVLAIDGTSRTQTAGWTAGGNSQDTDSFTDPVYGRSGANLLTGDTGECLAYQRALSSAELTQLRNYLKPKWGLS